MTEYSLQTYHPHDDQLMQNGKASLLDELDINPKAIKGAQEEYGELKKGPERAWQDHNWLYRVVCSKRKFIAKQPKSAVIGLYRTHAEMGQELPILVEHLKEVASTFISLKCDWEDSRDTVLEQEELISKYEDQIKAWELGTKVHNYDSLKEEERGELSDLMESLHDGFIPDLSNPSVRDVLMNAVFHWYNEEGRDAEMIELKTYRDLSQITYDAKMERCFVIREDADQLMQRFVLGLKYATRLSLEFEALDSEKKRKNLAVNILGSIERSADLCRQAQEYREESRITTAEDMQYALEIVKAHEELSTGSLEKRFLELENDKDKCETAITCEVQ